MLVDLSRGEYDITTDVSPFNPQNIRFLTGSYCPIERTAMSEHYQQTAPEVLEYILALWELAGQESLLR